MVRKLLLFIVLVTALAFSPTPASACDPAAVRFVQPSYGYGYSYGYGAAYSPFVTQQFLAFDAFGRPVFSPTLYNASLAVRFDPLPMSSPSVTVVGGRSRVFIFR